MELLKAFLFIFRFHANEVVLVMFDTFSNGIKNTLRKINIPKNQVKDDLLLY